ncbi:MAG: hypothetical protein NUV65_03085 [Candidatus Roizmanbacteria bacterium]|nr:hypothetical protein [Candidatus Roizmanbacteria bacterium]
MFFPEHNRTWKALSTTFFSKELQGFEVESKWRLLTENPVPTIIRFMDDMRAGRWNPVHIAKTMGKLPVGLRYFELQFEFWAIKDELESLSNYRQVAMVAVVPGADMFQVAFKAGGLPKFLCTDKQCLNPPLIRREERKGNWVREEEATIIILNRFPSADKVATMTRQKCYVYVHNLESRRNFSISADLCQYKSKTLSQVEVEYKGRSGIWLPDVTGQHITLDFLQIHRVLGERYGEIILPTTQTKMEWITEG